VAEVGVLVGMPERETAQAICALVALGLARVAGPSDEVAEQSNQDSLARTLARIDRKLQFFESAGYYDVLGVTKVATTSAIAKAFNDLKEMIASQRSLHPDHRELHGKLDLLLAKLKEAHATLGDPERRRLYDMPAPRDAGKPGAGRPSGEANSIMKSNAPVALPQPVQPMKPQIINLPQQAAQRFQQGRSRYDQKDVHAAEHLFREAVRLDPSQPHYHYHLAITLMILSQARHEHTHHEGCHVTCNLGGSLVSNPRVRYEAEHHLLRAAELDPSSVKVRLTLGHLYKEAGLTKKAENAFREALLLDGRNSVARRELGLDDGQDAPG
jgi:tetratricopeptide (TPR) repeat protein